jgi:hypothetical protein
MIAHKSGYMQRVQPRIAYKMILAQASKRQACFYISLLHNRAGYLLYMVGMRTFHHLCKY